MKLTPEAINKLMMACLAKHNDEMPGLIKVDGIVRGYVFEEANILAHKNEIRELLEELPAPFMEKTGGGWSFLQACMDKHGNQWTGVHTIMEALFALGIASGQAKLLMPKNMWQILPGGMPYYVVLEPKKEQTDDAQELQRL